MSDACIAAAQTECRAGDITANLIQHLQLAQLAATHNAQLLVFPELSLTGYELHLLKSHAITVGSGLLDALHEIARLSHMVIVVGAAVHADGNEKPHIASIVLHPTGKRTLYAKHFLHPGEEQFAVAGPINHAICKIGHYQAGLAICADTTHAEHPTAAAQLGADLYAASVLWSIKGYAVDAALMQGYAQAHSMDVLVANFAGISGGYACAGRSALWDARGFLCAQAPSQGTGLIVAQSLQGRWQADWIDHPALCN
jgi:predicted amidohydrolase